MFKDPGNQTSGLFGLNPLEAMPPILIYKTRAKNEDNMKIKPKWIENIPIVKGTWGLKNEWAMLLMLPSEGRGMDEDLFIQIVLFYKSLYPNLASQFKWGAGGELIKGPIFLKSDDGPSRNCKPQKSINAPRGHASWSRPSKHDLVHPGDG